MAVYSLSMYNVETFTVYKPVGMSKIQYLKKHYRYSLYKHMGMSNIQYLISNIDIHCTNLCECPISNI